jgi:hypothetical protein
MAQPLLDQILKLQAERRPRPFVRLAFPGSNFKIIASKYDTELIIKTRRVDKLIHIADADGEHLINYEFQSRYRRTTAKRMFVYAGALTATHNLEVSSVLFLLRPPKDILTLGHYEVKLFNQRTNAFEFIVVKLWELRDHILEGKKEYLPFVPFLLDISLKRDVALLRKQRDLVNLEKNPKRRAELAGFSALLARRYFASDLITELFKQEEQAMDVIWEDMPFVGEKIKQKTAEAKAEAQVEAKAQTLQKTIMEVLATRFDVANGKIARLVNSIHQPQKLEVIFRRALRAKSLDTVVNMLQQAKSQAKRKLRR